MIMRLEVVGRILPCVALVNAIPTLTFPINSQVPTVARVAVPFQFTFSASTFSSPFPLNYTLTRAPDWLSLDGASRTLSGTPSRAENLSIEITATDETGSAKMDSVLVVSANPAPAVKIPLENQLASFGMYSPPNSILYHTLSPFEFSFDPGTFEGDNLTYYAATLENTPLPSWIRFHEESLSFSGRAPQAGSVSQPPQSFGLQLIASDVTGFSGVAIPFYIVVERHALEFVKGFLHTNVTAGRPVNFTGLAGSLRLDGKAVPRSKVVSVDAQTPSWLSFDNSTFAFKGTAPLAPTSYNISVTAMDSYGNTANATVQVRVVKSAFVANIGPMNATVGAPFSCDLDEMVSNPSDVNMSVTIPRTSTSWLSFDNQTCILSGVVPPDTPPSNVSVILRVISMSSRTSDSRILILNIAPNSGSPTAVPTTAVAVTTNTPTGTTGNQLTGGLIAAIVVPTVIVVATIFLCLFYYVRKRRLTKKRLRTPSKSDLDALIQKSNEAQDIISAAENNPKSGGNKESDGTFPKDSKPRPESPSHSDVASSEPAGVENFWSPASTNDILPFYNQPEFSTSRVARNFSRKWKLPSPGESDCMGITARGDTSLSSNTGPSLDSQNPPNAAYRTMEGKGDNSKYLGDIPEIDWRESGAGDWSTKSGPGLSDFRNERPGYAMERSSSESNGMPIQGTAGKVTDGSDRAGPGNSNEALQRWIRRSVGSSPFFAGSSRSRKYRRAQSPLPPVHARNARSEANEKYLLEPGGVGARAALGTRHTSGQGTNRYLGISPRQLYRCARLSTQFSDGDSRFESAEPSPETEHFSFLSQSTAENENHCYGYPTFDQESYEMSEAVSSRNSIHYDSDELQEMSQPRERLIVREGVLVSGARVSHARTISTESNMAYEDYMYDEEDGRAATNIGAGSNGNIFVLVSQHGEESGRERSG